MFGRNLVAVGILILACIGGNYCKKNYQGHQVLRVIPETLQELSLLKKYHDIAHEVKFDFWRSPVALNHPVDIRLAGDSVRDFMGVLDMVNATYTVLIEDVQNLINKQVSRGQTTETDFDYGKYHSLEEIDNWMNSMVQMHGSVVQLFEVGTSYEGRKITGLKISSSSDPSASKPAVWLDGGIHAREWISPATVIYIAGQLISKYGQDPTVTKLVEGLDWYILPVFNVDGYVYTWTTDRMWRKTRSKNSGSACVGVDPNRNWDWHFGEAGTSKNPCSESYCGPRAFSEIEVKSVADFLAAHNSTIKCYVNFHSYSQLWMDPWGWTSALPKDFDKQDGLAAQAVKALESVYGTKYKHGSISNIIYPASGSTVDWTYGHLGIIYSYGVELRDTGKYGFLLPANEILPSGNETFQAIAVIGKHIIDG